MWQGEGQNFHLRKSIMREGVIIATSSLVKVEVNVSLTRKLMSSATVVGFTITIYQLPFQGKPALSLACYSCKVYL